MQDRQRLADATAAARAQRRPARPTTHGEGTMTVFLFPGQGSQFKGMGAGLFEEFPDLTATADRVLGYSIRELCVEDPRRELGRTRFTQPALYVVNALSHLKRVADTGVRPDFVAGHSLGEYSALFAAGAVDFETGLRLVKRRGELMSEAADGGMAAVIGLTVEEVRDLLRREGLTAIEVANHNSPRQVVVAGPKADIPAAREAFVRGGALHYVPLNVSGAFHSRLMAGTRERFIPLLREAVFRTPLIPVLSNVSARPHREGAIADKLAEQITHVVEWNDTIRYLLGQGEADFVEVGPGTVLTKLVGKIRDEAGSPVPAEPPAPSPAAARPPRSPLPLLRPLRWPLLPPPRRPRRSRWRSRRGRASPSCRCGRWPSPRPRSAIRTSAATTASPTPTSPAPCTAASPRWTSSCGWAGRACSASSAPRWSARTASRTRSAGSSARSRAVSRTG